MRQPLIARFSDEDHLLILDTFPSVFGADEGLDCENHTRFDRALGISFIGIFRVPDRRAFVGHPYTVSEDAITP